MKFKQTKHKSFISLFFLTILFLSDISAVAQNAKIVGYQPSYGFYDYINVSFCKVTHLNICFANPDSNGNLIIDRFNHIVERARDENPNIKILISLGGAGLSDEQKQNWSTLIDYYNNRTEFIKKIISFVNDNDLDGVDVDLEWDDITSGYTNFVIFLGDTLHAEGKLLSSALPGTYRYSQVTKEVLKANDFINLMAYDKTGPWDPDNPGQHSSYDYAVNSINFWKNNGVPKEKLVLGVPFYGYDFKENSVDAFKYADMVSINTSYADSDKVGNAYYNGRPTIRKKVQLASEDASGIMIWELTQDRYDEYSLLSTIHEKYNSLGFVTTGLCGNTTSISNTEITDLKIYPNPSSSVIYIESSQTISGNVLIYSFDGRLIRAIHKQAAKKTEINISDLKSGVYVVKIPIGDKLISRKLLVK